MKFNRLLKFKEGPQYTFSTGTQIYWGWAVTPKDIIILGAPQGSKVGRVMLYHFFNNFSPRKKCPYLELFCSAFSLIQTEYWEIRSISPIQSKCGKMRTRITPNTDTFHAVFLSSLEKLQSRSAEFLWRAYTKRFYSWNRRR